MTDDDWMVEAMSDGALVANVLVNLRRASLPEKKEDSRAPPLRWRVKQRRSRPMATSKATSTPSPTTPLSWSGATFPAADGLEDSSSPPDASAKSKVSSKSSLRLSVSGLLIHRSPAMTGQMWWWRRLIINSCFV